MVQGFGFSMKILGFTNASLEAILKLFGKVLPDRHCIPDSLDKVQRVIRDLGMDYVKIHACENDCVLFLINTQIWKHVPFVRSQGGKL
jgi:hypothetical protein